MLAADHSMCNPVTHFSFSDQALICESMTQVPPIDCMDSDVSDKAARFILNPQATTTDTST